MVTGAAHGMADRKSFADQLPDGATTLTDRTDESRRSACGDPGPATSSR